MQRLQIQDSFEPDSVTLTVAALRAGHLAVLPTETVYGLAADSQNPVAVAALRAEHRTLNEQRDSLGMLRDILVLVVSGLGGLGILLGGIEFMKDHSECTQ